MESTKKVNENDRLLPVANIGRIIKNNLPSEVKLSKESKEIFQECISEFISFLTSEASDTCNADKRKTLNGDDILQAMNNLGFDKYVPTLKVYLDKYRDSQKIESIDDNINSNDNVNNKDNINIKDNLNINY